jgi:hypothetical protein
MPKRRALRPGSRGEAVVGGLLGFLFGYMAAEALMGRYIHPLHGCRGGDRHARVWRDILLVPLAIPTAAALNRQRRTVTVVPERE